AESNRAKATARPSSVTPAVDPRKPFAPGRSSLIHRSSWRRRPSRSATRPSITCTNIVHLPGSAPPPTILPDRRDANAAPSDLRADRVEPVVVRLARPVAHIIDGLVRPVPSLTHPGSPFIGGVWSLGATAPCRRRQSAPDPLGRRGGGGAVGA